MQRSLESQNLRELLGLNQRGGQMLAITDLIAAGTMSLEMAAWLCSMMHDGTSLLVCANPGGAGKTTVMAALLGVLPPGSTIASVSGGRDIPVGPVKDPGYHYLLVHEFGAGPYYGYVWGQDVGRIMESRRRGWRFAATMHADTYDEMQHIMTSPPLAVTPEQLQAIDLLLFLCIRRLGTSTIRRVAQVWKLAKPEGEPHALAWSWDETLDEFQRRSVSVEHPMETTWQQVLAAWQTGGPRGLSEFRKRLLDLYQNGRLTAP